jgi:hypothetical protein
MGVGLPMSVLWLAWLARTLASSPCLFNVNDSEGLWSSLGRDDCSQITLNLAAGTMFVWPDAVRPPRVIVRAMPGGPVPIIRCGARGTIFATRRDGDYFEATGVVVEVRRPDFVSFQFACAWLMD